MTPAEQAKASALLAAGVTWENRDRWTAAQRSAYLAGLAEFRQRNPGLFTAAELQAAANYASAAAQRDPEFNLVREFGAALVETVEERAAQVSGVGEGIFSALSLTRWLIPAALIAAAVILLRNLSAATSAPKS
jgi:hypothetical protein